MARSLVRRNENEKDGADRHIEKWDSELVRYWSENKADPTMNKRGDVER